jgi:predicted transcriptional regulator
MSARAACRLESLGFERVYDYAAGKDDWTAAGLPAEADPPPASTAGSLVIVNLVTCSVDEAVGDVLALLQADGPPFAVVVDADRVVLGRLSRGRAERALVHRASIRVEEVMDPGPSTYRPDVPRSELLRTMRSQSLGWLLITTSEGVLVGVVARDDVEPPAWS